MDSSDNSEFCYHIGYERIEEGAKNVFMIKEPIYTLSSIFPLFLSC